MQYNQPFDQPSNPNASYIDGNPAAGIQGSIVPAASIEFPQRELVNFSLLSGLTPTNADLLQLAKAVQSGLVNWGIDIGAPNEIQITPVVPIANYQVGQRFIIKMSYGNTSTVQLNINGIGFAPVIHVDQTPINAWELLAGQLIEVAYDGANFELISGGQVGGVVTLRAPQNLYVDANIGSDTLYDGTSATIGGPHGGPFATIQKALATMQKYNLGGWTFYIHVANGVYTSTSPVTFPTPNGSGVVNITGNLSNPNAAEIFNTGTGSGWILGAGGVWQISGFGYRTTAPAPGDIGNGVSVSGATVCYVNDIAYNSCAGAHWLTGPGGYSLFGGTDTINGPASAHQYAYSGGQLLNATPGMPTLNITAPVNIAQFVLANDTAVARPMFTSITGASNVTGQKYSATGNGVIDTNGAGASYLPGTTAGAVATGGQYL